MEKIFGLCVDLLVWAGNLIGLTYVQINVWIFCVIEPIVFIVLVVILIKQYRTIKILKADGKQHLDLNNK